MNFWVYLGFGIVTLLIIVVVIFVFIGIFLCIEQYYKDKEKPGEWVREGFTDEEVKQICDEARKKVKQNDQSHA